MTLRDALIRLALHAGVSAHFECVGERALAGGWRVLFARHEPLAGMQRDKEIVVREVAHRGRTWCFDMHDGFIVARSAQRVARAEFERAQRCGAELAELETALSDAGHDAGVACERLASSDCDSDTRQRLYSKLSRALADSLDAAAAVTRVRDALHADAVPATPHKFVGGDWIVTAAGRASVQGNCLKPKLCMVMELASRKSLFHVLNREGLIIGWPQALEWGAQSAAGTATLHKHDIVHRDLKSLNLLVTQDWIVKVADFGLARFNNEGNLETLNKMRGTMAYCPPEAYFAQAFDYKSDVYSLAVIVWELVNRCLKGKYEAPFSEYKNLTMDFQIIIQVAKSHLRPTIPDRCPPAARAVIENAWVFEREERPEAAEVQQQLRSLIAAYEASPDEWDATIVPE